MLDILTADITVQNPTLGTVEIDLVEFGRGRWSYHLITVGGKKVHDLCNAEPMPKKLAEKHARNFGKTCRKDPQWGYVI